MILTTIWSLFIPPVKFSLYFHKEEQILDVFVDDNEKNIRTKINESNNINLDKNNIKVRKKKN